METLLADADEPAATEPEPTDLGNVIPDTAAGVPAITPRNYSGGSAIVKVTGTFQIDATIAINQPASISDGEMTWLQYGVSGALVKGRYECKGLTSYDPATGNMGKVDLVIEFSGT